MRQREKEPGHLLVVITAWMYIVLGILFIIHPSGMVKGLGYENLGMAALTDIMATYGGLFIGIGVSLFYLLKNDDTKLGLVLTVLTFGGFALGRSIGAVRFGGFYGLHCYWLVFELTYVLITYHFIKKYKSTELTK